MPIVLEHPDNLSAAHYKVIGEISYKWTLIEFLIHDLASYFLGLDKPAGRVVLFRTGGKEKITVLRTVALKWVKDPGTAKELQSIAAKAKALSTKRNEIAHGVWGHPAGRPHKLYLMYVKSEADRILPRAIHKTSKDLRSVIGELDNLIARIHHVYKNAGVRAP